ncbi:hypothetical protein I545_6888 [Mycobacterium kansasii 662]|uniref:Uncharacterized protein n=1 Tax=Mycobacterium kansasii 662 TaxID=1299326 RepID=X7XRL8_MYCKA|nr:hypothetical protein I545_6888 [Mycobacterium kansasii 662]
MGCYQEANTRFLLVNNNWRGLVLDSSRRKVHAISRDTIPCCTICRASAPS